VREVLQLAKGIVKVLDMLMKVFITEREKGVKSYSTREMIDYS